MRDAVTPSAQSLFENSLWNGHRSRIVKQTLRTPCNLARDWTTETNAITGCKYFCHGNLKFPSCARLWM